MNSLAAVREFSGTVLQQVCHFKVDVIVGDANAAAYKYCKRQEHQDLHNSSVAVMLREMQREVNTGPQLNAGFTTTINHPPQLHAATDLDCCFICHPYMGKASRTPNRERTLKPNHAMHFREQLADLRDRTDYPRGKKNGRCIARARNRSSVKGDSPASLPRPRGRHRSHGGTSRL